MADRYMMTDTEWGVQEVYTLAKIDNNLQFLAGTCKIGQLMVWLMVQLTVQQGSQNKDMDDKLCLALGGHHIPGNDETEACSCALPDQRCNDDLLRRGRKFPYRCSVMGCLGPPCSIRATRRR